MRPKFLHFDLKYVLHTIFSIMVLSVPFKTGFAQCGGDVLINSESFESGWGIWNDGGVDCDRVASNANTGTYSIELIDDTDESVVTTGNLNLSGYTSINVSFSYITNSMDNANEDFWLQISTNGGSSFTTVEEWNTNDEFVNNVRYNDMVSVSGPFTSNTQIRFRCDASGNADYVYLDDIVICGVLPAPCSGGITSFPYAQGFESGWGSWTQSGSDDFDWIRQSGGTGSSGTGPSGASEGSQYIYVEASSPNYPSKVTIVNGPCIDLSAETGATFNFDYHMLGSSVGTLDFEVSTNGGVSWTTEWTLSGDQGSSWLTAAVDISAYDGQSINVRFVGTTSSSWAGDIAVDDISLTVNVNTAPNANTDDTSTVSTPIAINVLSNDSDPDGNNITLTSIVSAPNHGGTATTNNNGTPGILTDDYVDYTPTGLYFGVETFTYQICDDGVPSECSTGTVNVTVSEPNTAPTALSDNAASNTEAIIIDVLGNDSDPQGDNITISAITVAPNHGGFASINNNGTPGNQADDYIDFSPTGMYFGVETFTYQICDDGSPSLCSTATVNVTVSANTAPTAVIDSANTDFTTPITINVLGNDSDSDGGQEISITSITVAPDQGGSANINNNGTPSDPSDDFINYTPSGLYIGTETFTYQICDNAKPITCATATVYVNVATCLDGSTTESSPNFAFGAEWKYDDSGVDLGTSWRDPSYLDDCWAYGNANLGFGDPMTTTINNHGKITYYFRKHFNVVDAGTINYLKLDLVRDDGAVVYINGNEVLRSNMPIGTIVNTTAAASNVSGSSETKIRPVIVTAEHLVDGDNVIAVEIHQDLPSSSDVNFDLAMTADIVDHSSDIYIAQNQYWNYSDDGTDLNTGWRSSNYIENTQDWETGTAELGYGDGDESTTIGTGTVYPTYYFRHYFNADDILTTDSLYLRLRKDDGAIVYINGVEVYRHGMGTGTINYSDWASFTAAGADESKFYDTTILATMINSGINVVAVEVHQVGSSSSDVSFELELSRLDGDPNAYPLTYETISGKVFLDIDVNRTLNSKDVGQGAIEVFCYQDRDLDGEIDVESDPRLFSDITNAIGDYELKTYFSEVQSIKSDVTASNGDAAQDGLGGTMSLNSTKHKSIVSFTLPNQVIDTVSSWSYYDGGDLADPTWVDLGYPETGWSSGTADFGFGDAGVNTTVASGNYAYYFRKTFTGGILAGTYNTARILLNRDDGAVIYLNGVEIARSNMPSGPITYNTLAASKVDGEAESKFHELIISNLSFNVGTNVLAVEIHQDNVSSSDIRFDLMMSIENGTVADVGYRFGNVQVPQGAKIIDAFLRVTSATTTETTSVIHIEGEAADNAAVFANTINNISSRARTAETTTWSNSKALLDGREMQLTGLTGIVQEITDRAGWSSGNAMAFILSGFENEIYSFDGGYAPELTISYLDTNQTTTQYIISVDPADMPEVYTFLTDATPTVTIGTSLRAVTNVNLGYIGSTSTCFATSDDDYDALHIINRFSGKNRRVGALGSSMEIEAIAMSRNADSLFAVDGGNFGLIDLATGAFTAYGSSIGTADGAAGSINLSDVDGLSYDLTRNMLWASHRRSGDYDLIFVIDITTGQFIPDVFGPGVDYVVAQGGGLLHDLDDIAIHPNTGNLFAMNNDNGAITNLVEIDISTGLPNVINNTGLNDMEGQGFHNDGLFYSTSGREGVPANAFYLVDTSNSFLTLVGFFESEGDFEGCDCKTGPSVNFVDGYVFEDMDGDSLFTAADVVDPGVDVSLYRDVDSNGVYSIGDILVETKVSDSTGYYAFAITQVGYYFLLIDTADIPLDAQFTTEENQPARFNVNGQVQFGNNFGYRNGAALPVELAHFTGENKGQKNNLYWTTTAEINNDHFKVQRSKDAITFETIGVVNGAGNSDQKLQYEFVDDQPFKGVNYYRLQQVDFDGTNDYSKIIDLEVKTEDVKGKLSLDLFPNPSHDYIKINGLQELDVNEVVTLNVYDINGVVQLTKIWTINDDAIELDINEFKNGIYFADLSTSKGLLQTLNFIKQDR